MDNNLICKNRVSVTWAVIPCENKWYNFDSNRRIFFDITLDSINFKKSSFWTNSIELKLYHVFLHEIKYRNAFLLLT